MFSFKVLYGFSLAYLYCQPYYSWVLAPLVSKIRDSLTQYCDNKTAPQWQTGGECMQCGEAGQRGDSLLVEQTEQDFSLLLKMAHDLKRMHCLFL